MCIFMWIPRECWIQESTKDFTQILTYHSYLNLQITFEAPPGIKRNLQRTYDAWDQDLFDSGSLARSQLLFALAWFHAILQERRNYIPQGWRQFYEFSFSDLRSGAAVICSATKDGNAPKWRYLHGLLENAIYGGRIDNEVDSKARDKSVYRVFHHIPSLFKSRFYWGSSFPFHMQFTEHLAFSCKSTCWERK